MLFLGSFRMPVLAATLGASTLALVLSLAAPAQAAAQGHGGGSGSAAGRATAPSVTGSATFAGYQTPSLTGSAISSAAGFTLPKLSCTSVYRAITPVAGVEVNNYATYSSAFVFTGCHNGKALYFPSLVVNGSETDYTSTPLSAGDVIKVGTNVTATGTTVKVTDVTKGVTKKLTGSGATPSAAYIGDSDWRTSGTLLGVPSFGKLTFTHCSVGGRTLASWNPVQYQRVNSSGVVQIATGALPSAGTAFPTYYKHS